MRVQLLLLLLAATCLSQGDARSLGKQTQEDSLPWLAQQAGRAGPDAAPRTSRGLLGRKLSAAAVAAVLQANTQTHKQRALLQSAIDDEPAIETLDELAVDLGLPGDFFGDFGGYYGYYSATPEPFIQVTDVGRRLLSLDEEDAPADAMPTLDMGVPGDAGGQGCYGYYGCYNGHPLVLGADIEATRRRLLADFGADERLEAALAELLAEVTFLREAFGVYGGYGYGAYGEGFNLDPVPDADRWQVEVQYRR